MISHRQLENTLSKMSCVLFIFVVAVVDLSFVFNNVTMSVVSEKLFLTKKKTPTFLFIECVIRSHKGRWKDENYDMRFRTSCISQLDILHLDLHITSNS